MMVGPIPRRFGVCEGRQCWFCAGLGFRAYGWSRAPGWRELWRRFILRREGGPMLSLTLRKVYAHFHDIQLGLYTIGPAEAGPDNYAPGTVIGRYCSIYYTARVLGPGEDGTEATGLLSWFPVSQKSGSVVIGHDVYVGHNVVILSTAERIGHGAVLGAGSVVTQPVPPYAIVTGNPARVVRYRFSDARIRELLASEWWKMSLEELQRMPPDFFRPLEEAGRPASG